MLSIARDSAPQVCTERLRHGTFASTHRLPASWHAMTNYSTVIPHTTIPSQMNVMLSARASHSSNERDADAECLAVMTAMSPLGLAASICKLPVGA